MSQTKHRAAIARAAVAALAAAAIASAALLLGSCAENGEQKKGSQDGDSIKVAFLILSSTPRDLKLVEEEINRIYAPKLGLPIELIPMSYGSVTETRASLLASRRTPDLVSIGGSALLSAADHNLLLPLESLLLDYGADIAAAVDPVYLRSGSIDGSLYGIPSLRDLASDYGVILRKDLAQLYGIDYSAVRKLADLEPLLKKIKAARPDMTSLVLESSSAPMLAYDNLYDGLGDDVGVLPGLSGSLQLEDLFASERYERLLGLMRRWNQAGYLLRDGATSAESPEALFESDAAFAAIYHQKPGFAEQLSRITGRPLVGIALTPAVATSATVNNVMWSIPRTAPHPAAAMRLLNLMYSDPALVNLLDWGIEGKHYVKVSASVIDYPPGVGPETNGYHANLGWEFGNQFISYLFKDDSPTLWQDMAAFNAAAVKSPAMGFTFVPVATKVQYEAVLAVIAEYRGALDTGTIDPAKYLPVFRARLKAAGIDAVIAEKQAQLLGWKRSQAEGGRRDTAKNSSANR
jgi:ABC-type sugar transport system, periplasmic component